MTRRANPEERLHRSVADYLNVALPSVSCWTTIPAGGGGRIRGAKLKAMGYCKGWPDLEIVWDSTVHYIELKVPGKYPGADQKKCHNNLRSAGARVAVCHRIEEVEGTLRGWGLPLRATTGAALPEEGEAA